LYVVIIGGLLAFSSLRKQPDLTTTSLVGLLFLCFAYKNLGAIQDTTHNRAAVLQTIMQYTPTSAESAALSTLRPALEPTLMSTDSRSVRNFHMFCDFLTIAALMAMELRRRRG
jgi:hypothetical protein